MQNLIQFFVRFSAFFFFILLEFVCLFLIIRNNDPQRAIFINSTNLISAKSNAWMDKAYEYSKLQEKVDSLANENARLKTLLYNSKQYQTIQKSNRKDTLFHQKYSIIKAQVIDNSISSRNNAITLNRGKRDGIEAGMGVLGDVGLVGIVKHSSKSFSSVLSILHNATRISTSVKRNNYFGSLMWKGFNPRKMSLEAVPKHADIKIGDTLQTSGYSHIFPAGIMVGTIDTFWIERGSNFYSIDVNLVNDMSQADVVYVVTNLVKVEQDSLEKMIKNE